MTRDKYDVTLRIGNKEDQVHKVVLTAYFPYFQVKFTQQFTEKKQKVIEFQGVDGDATASLIKLAYTGKFLVNVSNVNHYMLLQIFFDLESTKLFCKGFLMEHVDVKNVFGVRQLVELYQLIDLIETADKLTSKRFLEVTSVARRISFS